MSKFLIDEIEDEDKPRVDYSVHENVAGILMKIVRTWQREGRPDIAAEYWERAREKDHTYLLAMSELYTLKAKTEEYLYNHEDDDYY